MTALYKVEENWRTGHWGVDVSFLAFKGDDDARTVALDGGSVNGANWIATGGTVTLPGGWLCEWVVGVDLHVNEGENGWTDPVWNYGAGDYYWPWEPEYVPLIWVADVTVTYTISDLSGVIHTITDTSHFNYDAYGTAAVPGAFWSTTSNYVALVGDVTVSGSFTVSAEASLDLEGDLAGAGSNSLKLQERVPSSRAWTLEMNGWSDTQTTTGDSIDDNEIGFDTSFYRPFDDPILQYSGTLAEADVERSYTGGIAPGSIDYDSVSYALSGKGATVALSGNTLTFSATGTLPETTTSISFTDLYSPHTIIHQGTVKALDGGTVSGWDFSASNINPPTWNLVNSEWDDDTSTETWTTPHSTTYGGGWELDASGLTVGMAYVTSAGHAEYRGVPTAYGAALGSITTTLSADDDAADTSTPLTVPAITALTRNAIAIAEWSLSTPALFPQNNWSGSNCTVTYPGAGGVKIASIGALATCTRDFSASKDRLGGARYLRVTWQCDTAGASARLTISGQTFELVATVAGANETVIDLCRPNCYRSAGADFTSPKRGASGPLFDTTTGLPLRMCCCSCTCDADEQQNSLVDLELPLDGETPGTYTMYRGWGVARILTVQFHDLTVGAEFIFEDAELFWYTTPRVFAVPQGPLDETLAVHRMKADAGATTYMGPRCFWVEVDGAIIAECVDPFYADSSLKLHSDPPPIWPWHDYDTPDDVDVNHGIAFAPTTPASGSLWEAYNWPLFVNGVWYAAIPQTLTQTFRFYALDVPPGFASLTLVADKRIRSGIRGLGFDGCNPAIGYTVEIEDKNSDVQGASVGLYGIWEADPTPSNGTNTVESTILRGANERECDRVIVSVP